MLFAWGKAMAKLKYTFKSDTLFKMLFDSHPDLLKDLVSKLLDIPLESMEHFAVVNTELPPENYSGKFCRLDVHMVVDGQHVNLEIQVNDEGD